MVKVCSRCRESKDLEVFPRNRTTSDGRHCYCKPCHNVLRKEWEAKNPGKRAYFFAKFYYGEKFQGIRAAYQHRANLKRCYGLTPDEYKAMASAQQNRCAICLRDEPKKYVRRGVRMRLGVDHNHATGEVRGLLCHNCNRALGMVNDSADIALRMVAYLKKHETRPAIGLVQAA